ncbi:MAG: glycosyltransferase family 39 protein [Thermoanaerobaculia bacterium]
MADDMGPSRRTERWAVTALLVYFAACALWQARSASPTFDEPAHLAAGVSYWRSGDFRMNPEHPPGLELLAALPVMAARPWPDGADASGSRAELARLWEMGGRRVAAEWAYAHELFYGATDATLARFGVERASDLPTEERIGREGWLHDIDRLFFLARLPMVGLGLLLALAVRGWARELFGPSGGLLALALAACDPNLLAHSALVTADVGLALFGFLGTWTLWRFRSRPGFSRGAAFVACVACAFLSKHSAPLFVPVWVALALLPSREEGAGGRGRGAAGRLALLCAALLVAWAALWCVYGLRYATRADGGEGPVDIRAAVERTAAVRAAFERVPDGPTELDIYRAGRHARLALGDRLLLAAARGRLLPEAYLGGLAYARLHSLARWSFLDGEISPRGFRSFFAWAFLWKTPLVTLAVLLAAVVVLPRRGRLDTLLFLWLPPAVLFAAAVVSHLNIGHRHLLPVYPFLWTACGVLGPRIQARLGTQGSVGALAIVALGCSVVLAPPWRPQPVHPRYLAFFNELAGGPREGSHRLVDSSLDWGQDLGRLARWLEREGIDEPIGLSYFGMADPRWYGIRHRKLTGGYSLEPPFEGAAVELPPGALVAISFTNLRGPYLGPDGGAAWERLLRGAERVATIGGSIAVFRLAGAPPGGVVD